MDKMPDRIYVFENYMFNVGGIPRYLATDSPIFSDVETEYIKKTEPIEGVNACVDAFEYCFGETGNGAGYLTDVITEDLAKKIIKILKRYHEISGGE